MAQTVGEAIGIREPMTGEPGLSAPTACDANGHGKELRSFIPQGGLGGPVQCSGVRDHP